MRVVRLPSSDITALGFPLDTGTSIRAVESINTAVDVLNEDAQSEVRLLVHPVLETLPLKIEEVQVPDTLLTNLWTAISTGVPGIVQVLTVSVFVSNKTGLWNSHTSPTTLISFFLLDGWGTASHVPLLHRTDAVWFFWFRTSSILWIPLKNVEGFLKTWSVLLTTSTLSLKSFPSAFGLSAISETKTTVAEVFLTALSIVPVLVASETILSFQPLKSFH